ncbi:hypothetical protein GCM10010524_27820 [Streptomyces mexicanus]
MYRARLDGGMCTPRRASRHGNRRVSGSSARTQAAGPVLVRRSTVVLERYNTVLDELFAGADL